MDADDHAEPVAPRASKPALRVVEPAAVDPRRVVLIGTAGWLIAAVVLLPFWNWLGEHSYRWWLWTCLIGAGLGLLGSLLMRKHHREGRIRSE